MVAAALAVAATGGGARAADVAGLWRTPVAGGVIRIEHCGEEICGRSVSSAELLANPDQADIRNPDPALRGRPVKGLLVLKLPAKGVDEWGDGWIYDPRRGATYHGAAKLDDSGVLKVTGCIVVPLCQTQTWTRAEGG